MKITDLIFAFIVSVTLLGCGDNKIELTKKEEKVSQRICGYGVKSPEIETYLSNGLGKTLKTVEECVNDFRVILMSSTGSDTVQLQKRSDFLKETLLTVRNMNFDRVDNIKVVVPKTDLFINYMK